MPIVPPPKKNQKASGGLNGSQGGPAVPGASGKLEVPRHVASRGAAPIVNGNGAASMPLYGSGAGGPYLPQKQPQSTKSSRKALS